jgi:hypothetical protein
VTSSIGIPFPGPSTPNGIVAGYFLDKTAGSDPKRYARHVILQNSVRARGATSVGIMLMTDGALVRGNHVVTEGPQARAIGVAGSNGYVGQNRIAGAGAYAVRLAPFNSMTASRNDVRENDFGEFKAVVVDVMLDSGASDNVLLGSSGTVTDLGSGTEIKGLKPVPK